MVAVQDGDRIGVVLADDHVVVRRGLAMLLNRFEDIAMLAEAGSGDEALAAVEREAPDVLVLDLNMPGRPAFEVLEELVERRPEVAVVVLTMEQDPGLASRAIELGARGYLVKRTAEEELMAAIRAVAAGEEYVGGDVRAAIGRRRREESRPGRLTAREQEVLRMIALGHTHPEIAEQLEISVRTVESHRMHIMQKANLDSRPQLVRYALEHGLLEAGPGASP